MLRDAERCEKFWIVRDNFRRRLTAVKLTEQPGNGFDDERIGIAGKETVAVAEIWKEPQFGEAAGNQIFLDAKFRSQRRLCFGFFNEECQPVLSILQRTQLPGKCNLFFREVHGAETFSVRWAGRRFGRRWCRWLFVMLDGLTVTRFIAARRTGREWFATGRRQLSSRRLDAAESAAKFVNLAFVGELLTLGDLDEFEHFVELVNHLLERSGDFGGVRDGLTDGGGFGGAKISGPDPLTRLRRLRAAVGPAFPGKFALRFT